MPRRARIWLPAIIGLMLLSGCTSPGQGPGTDGVPTDDGDDGAIDQGTDALPLPPTASFFGLELSGISAPGHRPAVDYVDADDRFDLWLGGDDGGSLWLGTAEGSFVTADADGATVSDGPVSAATMGDLDGDGRHDIVVAHAGGLTIIDNGNGSYDQRSIAWIGAATVALATADLDNDGALDVIVSDADGGLWALDNMGDGSLDEARSLVADDASSGFFLLDADDDLLLDIIVAPATGGLRLWLNQQGANGTFEARGDRDGLPRQGHVTGLFGADLDNDRRIDIVASTNEGIWFYESTGRTGFRDKSDDMRLPTGGTYEAPVVFDIDNDGWQDLVAIDGEGVVQVWWNAEGQGLVAKQSMSGAVPLGGLVVADMDRDGYQDLLALSYDGAPLRFDNRRDDGVWFSVRLIGQNATTAGVGSKVELTIGSSFPMFRQVGGVAALNVALPLDPHFGFGSATGQGKGSDMALVILWPSGTFQGRDIPGEEGFDARVTARENTEELAWEEGGPC